MTLKKILVSAAAVLTVMTSVPAVEENLGTSITTISASASSVITDSEVNSYDAQWRAYPYVVKRNYYPTGSSYAMNRTVQHLLNITNNAGLVEDMYIGSASDRAIRNFQRSRGLSVDGIVGNATWNKLISEARALADSSSSSSSSIKCNADAAYWYAKTYWNKRNPAYNYYSGRNCANFISQLLIHAGVPASSEWKNGSYAFVNVDGLRDYFVKTYNVQYYSNPGVSSIKPYDVIYTNNGCHVMVVMNVKNGTVDASGNTNNRDCIAVSRSLISGVLKTSSLF